MFQIEAIEPGKLEKNLIVNIFFLRPIPPAKM